MNHAAYSQGREGERERERQREQCIRVHSDELFTNFYANVILMLKILIDMQKETYCIKWYAHRKFTPHTETLLH